MPLVNTAQTLRFARTSGYCIGAFNIVDYLTLEAVVRSAHRQNAPAIIQTSSGTVKRYTPAALVEWSRRLADQYDAQICLHLDHGTEPELIRACVEAGYSSVMIDGSHYPFEENVNRTRPVVEMAHAYGVAVEGEIGVLAGIEDDFSVDADKAKYTSPQEAIDFQAQTGVDFLAVAIGTAHGFYKVEPRLDIDTLREINSKVDFPLVIHGGTGLKPEVVRLLVESGGSKFNVSTQLKKTYIESLEQFIKAHPNQYEPLKLLEFTQNQLIEVITNYIALLGSKDRIARQENK